jgi:hypothetical protein
MRNCRAGVYIHQQGLDARAPAANAMLVLQHLVEC